MKSWGRVMPGYPRVYTFFFSFLFLNAFPGDSKGQTGLRVAIVNKWQPVGLQSGLWKWRVSVHPIF